MSTLAGSATYAPYLNELSNTGICRPLVCNEWVYGSEELDRWRLRL